MQSEFQAGWLQGADEGAPRPSDPANTALALRGTAARRRARHRELSGAGHDLSRTAGRRRGRTGRTPGTRRLPSISSASSRYAPTRAFGDVVRRYGTLLAQNARRRRCGDHLAAEPLRAGQLEQRRFRRVRRCDDRDAARVQRRGLTCTLVDLAPGRARSAPAASSSGASVGDGDAARVEPWAVARLRRLLAAQPAGSCLTRRRHGRAHGDPRSRRCDDFCSLTTARTAFSLRSIRAARRANSAAFRVRSRSRTVSDCGLLRRPRRRTRDPRRRQRAAGAERGSSPRSLRRPPPFQRSRGHGDRNAHLRVVFAPFAGARVAELGDGRRQRGNEYRAFPRCDGSAAGGVLARLHRHIHASAAAGTFNRQYDCTRLDAFTTRARHVFVRCAGSSRRRRTLYTHADADGGSSELIVGEEFHAARRADRPRGSKASRVLHSRRAIRSYDLRGSDALSEFCTATAC